MKFAALKDAKCNKISPAGETTLKAGESETFTCEHVLAGGRQAGLHEHRDDHGWRERKKVEQGRREDQRRTQTGLHDHEVPGNPRLGQGLHGRSARGHVGQIVDYELIVKNTGNTPLTFSNFTDTKCVEIVEGAKELLPGEETTYTCHHVITEVGDWVNEGTITGTPPGESPITHTRTRWSSTTPSSRSKSSSGCPRTRRSRPSNCRARSARSSSTRSSSRTPRKSR